MSKSSSSKPSANIMDVPTDVLKEIRKFNTNLEATGIARVNITFKDCFLQEESVKKAIKDFFVEELKSAIINRAILNITNKMVTFFNSPDVQEYLPDIIKKIKTVELKPNITLQNITRINIMNIEEDLKWLPTFFMMTTIIVVENCDNITELIFPEAKTVTVKDCKKLTKLSCLKVKYVTVKNCDNITELISPEARIMFVQNCNNLTRLSWYKNACVKVGNYNSFHRETKEEEKSALMTEEQESDTDSRGQPNTAVRSADIEEPNQDANKSCCIIS